MKRNPVINRMTVFISMFALGLLTAACSGEQDGEGGGDALTGTISIDGSSTVYPMSEAVAEEFLSIEPRVRVTVGVSGTGGGFQKFISGEIDINDASREIRSSEIELAEASGVSFMEIPVAYDGLSVVVNQANDWVDYLTVEELNRIWEPGSNVDSWDDVRPEWPNVPLTLYGPGTDSGTFDYFAEVINGDVGLSRPDYTSSEDDNVLVQGISGDANSLGFFGYAYYAANRNQLKLVPIDGGNGPVSPTPETINNGSYAPLSRPLLIYLRGESAQRPEVKTFVEFYLNNAAQLAEEVGYVALPEESYEESLRALAEF